MSATGASVAVVTGGGSGIGREAAAMLREAGHDVVVWDVANGDIDCDISDLDSVTAAMEQTVREHGVPTRVVASAGIGSSGLLLAIDAAEWQRVLAVNLTGTFHTIRAAARAMVDAEVEGSIVVVSSISGCVSKAGLDMLVKVAAVEWGVHGIRVNAVGPGVTRSPMLPDAEKWPAWVEGMSKRTALRRLGEPGDVAQAIVGVLEMSWVTGQVLHADGGLSLHSPIDAYGQVEKLMRLKKLQELHKAKQRAAEA
jgi:NAD(P)-dependent dehydrogenase (short-subunit alcohol dehydrogenase family)